jgi:hypothetical protein
MHSLSVFLDKRLEFSVCGVTSTVPLAIPRLGNSDLFCDWERFHVVDSLYGKNAYRFVEHARPSSLQQRGATPECAQTIIDDYCVFNCSSCIHLTSGKVIVPFSDDNVFVCVLASPCGFELHFLNEYVILKTGEHVKRNAPLKDGSARQLHESWGIVTYRDVPLLLDLHGTRKSSNLTCVPAVVEGARSFASHWEGHAVFTVEPDRQTCRWECVDALGNVLHWTRQMARDVAPDRRMVQVIGPGRVLWAGPLALGGQGIGVKHPDGSETERVMPWLRPLGVLSDAAGGVVVYQMPAGEIVVETVDHQGAQRGVWTVGKLGAKQYVGFYAGGDRYIYLHDERRLMQIVLTETPTPSKPPKVTCTVAGHGPPDFHIPEPIHIPYGSSTMAILPISAPDKARLREVISTILDLRLKALLATSFSGRVTFEIDASGLRESALKSYIKTIELHLHDMQRLALVNELTTVNGKPLNIAYKLIRDPGAGRAGP